MALTRCRLQPRPETELQASKHSQQHKAARAADQHQPVLGARGRRRDGAGALRLLPRETPAGRGDVGTQCRRRRRACGEMEAGVGGVVARGRSAKFICTHFTFELQSHCGPTGEPAREAARSRPGEDQHRNLKSLIKLQISVLNKLLWLQRSGQTDAAVLMRPPMSN